MPSQFTEAATTLMAREAAEAGDAVVRMLATNAATFAALGRRLRETPPTVAITCARGSSDHAATYGKYLIETMTGVPVASAAPSVSSIFAARPAAAGALCIAVSQSGRSPDLIAAASAYREAGGHLVAFVNDVASPLAAAADTLVPLCAGPERSVAATKSYIGALAAFAALAAEWADDAALRAAVAALPGDLARARALDWSGLTPMLRDAANLFVIARGPALGPAQEVALKLKETCGLHAEAFSAAEVRHGPMAVVGPGFPLLALATSDAAGDDVRATAAALGQHGARVALADARADGAGLLPALAAHPAIEPILMTQSFYAAASGLSLSRGLDPDSPPLLSKVTRTV